MQGAIEHMSNSWLAVCLLALALGLRHGLDADHLAAVDGLTRLHAARGASFARFSGLLFSLGHGTVVVAVAVVIGTLNRHIIVPTWLDLLGGAVSVGFLLLLGLANLRALWFALPGAVVMPVGIKARWLGSLVGSRGAASVAATGALFALSFDVVSQSALFAMVAARFGGAWHALVLGLLFMVGMVVTDGVNGLWVSRLMSRADRMAAMASRVMGGTVAAMSFLVAGFGIARMASAGFDHWRQDKELLLGCAVIAAMIVGYVATVALGRRPVVDGLTAPCKPVPYTAPHAEGPCNDSPFRWTRRWRRNSTCGLPNAPTTTAAKRCATCYGPNCSKRA